MKPESVSGDQSLPIPDIEKLEFEHGIDAAQIWAERLRREVNKQKGGQAKAELISVLATGEHAEISWADEEFVLAENPSLNENQVRAVVKVRNKQCADELTHTKECRVAVHALLHAMMGRTSLEVLRVDPLYDENDKKDMDPAVTWNRIMATHILEREGPGIQKQIISVNKLLHQFTAFTA